VSDTENETPEVVRIAVDVDVPTTFKGAGLVPVDDWLGTAEAWCEMVDGRLKFRALYLDPPLSIDEMARADWGDLAQHLTYNAALKHRSPSAFDMPTTIPGSVNTGITFEFRDQAAAAAAHQRTYNRLTFTDYERVLELADKGGPDAVAEAFHVGRRQANRYIRRARDEMKR
jgi:hypothetical protein